LVFLTDPHSDRLGFNGYNITIERIQMKKLALAMVASAAAHFCFAGDSAGLAGIVNTSGTVEVNNFTQPRDIWTVYFSNDPTESAVLLAYVGFRKLGQHQLSLEWSDQKGKVVDGCSFNPTSVTKLPHIHTITCEWGGRQPDGGLTFTVYDKFEGKREKVGDMFLPSKQRL